MKWPAMAGLLVLVLILALPGAQAERFKETFTCLDDPLLSLCIESKVFRSLTVENLNVLDTLNVANLTYINQMMINTTLGIFVNGTNIDDIYVNEAGDTMTGDLNMTGNNITSVSDLAGSYTSHMSFDSNGDIGVWL